MFKQLDTKHWGTISYYSHTNEVIKQFNSVLDHMLIKYVIEHSIKTWNLYLEQALFATCIHTHFTIKHSSFYLLYEINSKLSEDAVMSTFDKYDEWIDSALFLSREHVLVLKETMTKTMKNKKCWNSKMNKKKKYWPENWILIRTKKTKKFEIHWYGSYQIV